LTSAQRIVNEVCKHTGVPMPIVMSRSGAADPVRTRNLCYLFVRKHLKWTVAKTGSHFGRHHSTVLTGIKNIEHDIRSYPEFRSAVERMAASIEMLAIDFNIENIPPIGFVQRRVFAIKNAINIYKETVNWTGLP